MISVVIPVLNGEQYLEEVLTSVTTQEVDAEVEVLVIDSGSTDRSLELIRSFPQVALLEIPQSEFGHGRTRNLGVQRTTGELIAFLTQDATPAGNGWLAAFVDAFEMGARVGAAYGPHLPREGGNPLMARLLIDHFGEMSPDGNPVIQNPGDDTYLSNSNSCIARSAWEQTPFRDLPYAEDQAFGHDILANGWSKVFMPAAGALHSHDYGMFESFKRYFDEYRGLNDSIGEKTDASAGKAFEIVRDAIAKDVRFLAGRGESTASQAAWAARSAAFHTGRILFGGLGARADRVPPRLRAALSFESRSDGIARHIPSYEEEFAHRYVGEVERHGVVPLTPPAPHDVDRPMHIAWIVPPFTVGSGGHTTIFRMITALEQRGHSCSIWIHDPHNLEVHGEEAARQRVLDYFMQLNATVHLGFRHWSGADVAVATGWDTVYPMLRLDHCKSRAYFVQDHEPEFYPTSAERIFAERSYGYGLHCITASPWLGQVVSELYGANATPFLLGVNTEEYAPLDYPRRNDTVAFYARHFTPRRGVELGMLALQQVKERRPETRIVLYGAHVEMFAPFPHEHLGVVSHERLRRLYAESTVGLSLSLTNYSLIPCEMLACGLPVVELRGRACESVFGDDGSIVELADDDPTDIADKICALLDDRARREQLSANGLEFAAKCTWESVADTVEGALAQTLADRLEEAEVPTHQWRAGSVI
ncbi:MAG TPA: glycosyltransferase [Solirubrobacterales bacterium]|nr:glycosyltransferase [Solirubrobacterales bacterium]